MKTTPYVLGVIVLVILASAVALAFRNKDSERVVSVGTYEECVAAGYPVLETYPEQCHTPDGRNFVHTVATTTAPTTSNAPVSSPNVSDLIRVQTPTPNQTISSGFDLKGEAKGGWYFEASFGGWIEDSNGKKIVVFPVQADGDWMTLNFVPFSEIVTFSPPETSAGYLVLRNDNPSGLPENDRQIVIPVKFATSSVSNISVKAYFTNVLMAGVQNTDCTKVYPVTRSIPKTTSTGKAAIEELLKGPAANEKSDGFSTSLKSGTKLNSLTITNGVARADFNEALDERVGGSCLVTSIRSQIEQTLKQFASVKSVVISINGKSEDILQP